MKNANRSPLFDAVSKRYKRFSADLGQQEEDLAPLGETYPSIEPGTDEDDVMLHEGENEDEKGDLAPDSDEDGIGDEERRILTDPRLSDQEKALMLRQIGSDKADILDLDDEEEDES